MARTYNDLIAKVLQWSNRDAEVFDLSNSTTWTVENSGLLGDFVTYAADKAYRHIRIPPMERTATIVPTQDMIDNNYISVPPDLVEFIHIRLIDAYGTGNSIILNNKADTRTFHDFEAEKYDPQFTWTRQSNRILLPRQPGVQEDQMYEIFYYGRFAQPGTMYDISYANYLEGVIGIMDDDLMPPAVVYYNQHPTSIFADLSETAFNDLLTGDMASPEDVMPDEVFNWFIHENERILLFGALGEAFSFLQEDDQATKYLQLWQTELDELNTEEMRRHASGGNVQINFNGRGLI